MNWKSILLCMLAIALLVGCGGGGRPSSGAPGGDSAQTVESGGEGLIGTGGAENGHESEGPYDRNYPDEDRQAPPGEDPSNGEEGEGESGQNEDDDSGGGGSGEGDSEEEPGGTVQGSASIDTTPDSVSGEPREIPENTFGFWLLSKSGEFLSITNETEPGFAQDPPTYRVEPGECYFLVSAVGPLTSSGRPDGVEGSTPGTTALAKFATAFAWDAGALDYLDERSGPSRTVNPGLPEFELAGDCSGRRMLEDAGIPVPRPVYQEDSSDGVIDLAGPEANGGEGLFRAIDMALPVQRPHQTAVKIRRGSIGPNGQVDPKNPEVLEPMDWVAMSAGIGHPDFQVVPATSRAMLSVGIRISPGAEGTVSVRWRDSKYEFVSDPHAEPGRGTRGLSDHGPVWRRPTLHGEPDPGIFMSYYQNLSGDRFIPRLQDVRLKVEQNSD